MKTLLTIFTLVFTVMFSSTSFAEWTKVIENVSGHTFYIDFDRIKKNDGFVYYWYMRDYLKPDKYGDMSSVNLWEVDCNIPRKGRKLYATYHTQPMGNGNPSTVSPDKRQWVHPKPKTVMEKLIQIACSR